jgi:hypothetical protein
MAKTRAKKTKTKAVEKPLPDGLVLGVLVRYYRNGWHVGKLDSWSKGTAKILPPSVHDTEAATGKRRITVCAANVEPIEVVAGSV